MLLQLTHDDLMHWSFGDNGVYQFWISPADLKKRNWEAARMTFDAIDEAEMATCLGAAARVCLPIRQAKLDRFARRGGKGRGRCGWLSNL
jgi:hypothetical protein